MRVKAILLVPFTGVLLVAAPGSRACPRRCTCYVSTEVHCTFRYLTSIPDSIPPNVERINLGYNSLVRLTGADFTGLSKLELLLLHSNGIHTVAGRTFAGLQALQVLKMSYNKVRKLEKDTFRGLRSLTRLYMDHNSIEFINPEAFYGLRALRLVQLEGNRLTKLHPDTFVSRRFLQIFRTSSIKYLHLSDNFLPALPGEMLSYMPDLESLYLHGNPWVCDCHLGWLPGWMQEKPDVIKCKKDRGPSGRQQCPTCMNPQRARGRPFALVPAAAFLCVKPVIDPSLKPTRLTVPEDSGSASISPQDFLAPLGSLALNMTDQFGNTANVVCSVRKPWGALPLAFAEENDHIMLNVSLSTFLVCDVASSDIQPVWRVLALYSDGPLRLERSRLLSETPQLCYKYKQVAPKPEDVFTSVEADLRADPSWLMQDHISLQLNRSATRLGTLQVQYTSDAHVTLPATEAEPVGHKWTMISRSNDTRLEHTVPVGGTVTLACPGQGDPSPHLEWLLADGSKVQAPFVSEDGRVLIDSSGELELQMADGFDTGTYHCVSTNHHDADVLTHRVTVVGPHVEAHEHGDRRTVFAGDTLDLPCRATGTPDPSVSWVLPGNSVLLRSSGGKQILSNGTLRILQVAPDDHGHYRCVAANPSGVDFLLFQVSVQMKGQRPLEKGEDADGSGLGEPRASAHPQESAPLGAEPGKQASRTSKDKGALVALGRGGSTHPWLREYRRHLPASARRVDPRHWAALLEKAKKNTLPERGEGTPAGAPTPLSQLPSAPGEEEGSSGALPPGEEALGPVATTPGAPAGTVTMGPRATSGSLVANRAAGSDVSPMVSPPVPPGNPTDLKQSPASETAAMVESVGPTRSSKTQGAASQSPAPVPPPPPGAAEFQDSDQMGRQERFQRAPPTTRRTLSEDAGISTRADVASESPHRSGHQIPVTGASEARSQHVYRHPAQGLGTSKRPPGPHPAAHPSSQIPRNSTASLQLPRRSGRRKLWHRGRILSPYRTPVLRQHGSGIVWPAARASAGESATTPSASKRDARRPSGPPREELTSATAALSFLGVNPSTPANTDIARVTTEPSTTVAQNPSVLSENEPKVEMEKTSPTVKYFSAERARGAPAGSAVTHAPTSAPVNKPLIANSSSLGVSSTSKATAPSGTSLPGPITKPRVPTALPVTEFPQRKIPWHQISVNNHEQNGILKKLRESGLQKSTATELPGVSPALPTNSFPPVPASTFPARLMHIPPATLAATPHSTPKAPRPGGRPAGTELPPLASREPSRMSFQPGPAATPASPPTAPPSVLVYKTQAAGPRSPENPRDGEPQRKRNGENLSPGQSAGSSLPAAAAPAPAETSAERGDSAPSGPPLGHTGGIWSTASPRSGTLHPTAGTGPPPRPPIPSGGVPASLSPTPKAVTDRWATPVSHTGTAAVVTVKAPSRHPADLQQSAGATAPPQQPDARPTAGTARLTHPSWVRPAPTPALVTIRSQDPELAPLPWTEHQSGPKSYPEMAGKGENPGTSEVPTLSSPEATSDTTSDASNQGGQTADEKASQQIATSRGAPWDSWLSSGFEKPRIVGGNAASFTVAAHSDAFLPCAASGSPPPTVRWTRVSSGLELSKGKRNSRFQVLPNGTLSIQSISIQDHGQYLCSASNPLGTDHLHVTLSVVSYPPRILERRAEQIMVHSGSTVELTCRAEGRPSPLVSWILPNQSVVSASSEGKRHALVTPEGTLVIRHLSVYDRGFYKCVASNPAGQDSRLVRVQVIAAPPVILEQRRQVLAGSWGGSVQLPCTAEGAPRPHVHWVLPDGAEVKPPRATDARLSLYANGTLHIRSLALSDSGTYECIATSSTGSDRRVVTLRVEGQGASPRIEVTSPRWTEVNWGDRLLLNCSAAGEPTPQITWRLPSKAVVDRWHRMGSRIHVYPNGSLSVGSVAEKDGGDYLCAARNSAGEDLALMRVGLRLKPAKIDHAPPFSRQALQGRDFWVDCRASGSPPPEISWSLPGGRRIHQAGQAARSGPGAGRYTLFDNGTLHLAAVGMAEEGDYACRAQNALGSDEMRVHLSVLSAAPRIKRGFQTSVSVGTGDTAVLDCEAVGEPRPSVFWLLPSGHAISSSSGRYAVHANGSLSVHEAQALDSGEYVCVARSPGGGDTKTYRVDVVSRPPLINGIAANRTVVRATAVRHSRQRLDCRAEGTPPPRVQWVMPDSVVLPAPYQGSRVSVHANGTLEIRNVRLSDSADFVCVARNAAGESALVVRLDVRDVLRRPSFRSPAHERVAAQLGRPAALHCPADGNPPPDVTWILPDGTTRFARGPQRSPYLVAGNGSLLIHKTTRREAGRYRCAARNPVGYIEKLIVLEIGQSPVILTDAPGTVRGFAGDPVWLHCVSAGAPKPRITWTTPGGSALDRPPGNGRYTLHENGTLVIQEATARDGGNYVCQAQNSVGQALITVPVTIVAFPPRITHRPPSSLRTRVGVAFQLHCVALGAPKPEVTWEMPGRSPLSRAREGRSHGGELRLPPGTLVLRNPQASDSGLYRCTARNALGSDHAATHVQVL